MKKLLLIIGMLIGVCTIQAAAPSSDCQGAMARFNSAKAAMSASQTAFGSAQTVVQNAVKAFGTASEAYQKVPSSANLIVENNANKQFENALSAAKNQAQNYSNTMAGLIDTYVDARIEGCILKPQF